jgi:hypothetical protein
MNNEQPPNEHTDPWESEMSREFDKRVRDLHEAPLTFDNVKGKAMTIRRNRRIAVAGGILAAAAVVVPIAVLAGNGLGDSNEIPPATTSPSPTRATDPNDPTPTTEAPQSGLGVSYLEGTTWHRADGTTVELDEAYFSAVELGDQLVATTNTNGRFTVDLIDADGSVVDSDKAYSQPVTNADKTTVAYITREGELMTRWADGQVGMGDGFVDGDSVAGVAGGPNCYEVEDGCVVYVNHGDGSAPEVLDSHGIREVVIPNAIKVNDLSASGLVAAQVSYSDTGSCSEVFDPAEGTQVFETCDASLFAFSPDASHLSGSSAYLDGIGPGYVAILDGTTGTEVTRLSPDQGYVRESVWEDPQHLLVTTYHFEQGEWRVYRLGVDGTSEQVLSSTSGDEVTPAFTLLGGS